MSTTPQPAITPAAADDLPVVVIGAGPVGLAAAAHLRHRDLPHLVLEAGPAVGAAVSDWGHIRTFTPWKYVVDATAEKLLAPTGWTPPTGDVAPTGSDIVEHYLTPLAAVLGDAVRTGARVIAVTRAGLDKARTVGRDRRPFLVRVEQADGGYEDITARAVIDASGTWGQPNPLGGSGLPARGEAAAAAAGFMAGPLPDVLGRDRARFAGRTTVVVGMGHSAANTLLNLAELARTEPGTRIVWAIRATDASRLYGGGAADELPDRGKLGTDLRSLVLSGGIELVPSFSTTSLDLDDGGQTVTITGLTPDGERRIAGAHQVAAATGFRPDLAMLGELQLDLHPGLEAPSALAPLIDPSHHSCGTVPAHGHRDLAHPDAGFYIVGMKAYGRAPTFLITTGNEEVRSVVAALAGDLAAADEVQLALPETGVCSTGGLALNDDAVDDGFCCGTPSADSPTAETAPEQAADPHHRPLPAGVAPQGFSTGLAGGRGLDLVEQSAAAAPSAGGSCCG